jgi:hypothetical protein
MDFTRPARLVHQVVSAGIVHPAPTRDEWLGIEAATNDRPESLEGGIETRMLRPYGARTCLRSRNFATLREGNDGRLWVTWACEDERRAEYPIEASP